MVSFNYINKFCLKVHSLSWRGIFVAAFLLSLTGLAEAEVRDRSAIAPEDTSSRIWNIGFEGNQRYSNIVLRDVIAAEPPSFWRKMLFWRKSGSILTQTLLLKDVIRLERFYQRRGYDDAEVSYRVQPGKRPWKKKVVFQIEPNVPITIRQLEVDYIGSPEVIDFVRNNPAFERAMNRQPFHTGRRYEVIREPDVKGQLILALKNLGFAYADMNITTSVDSSANRANISFQINPGPRTYIDSINVTGEYTVSDDMIRRNSGLNIGSYFSEKKIQDAQRELFNHPLFRFATISIPEQPRDSSLTLLFRVREHEKRSIGLKLGLGREDIVRGQVNWTHRNVANYGHRFNATAYASFIEQQVSLDYLFPYVFNENSSFLLNPFAQHLLEPNFELFRLGMNNSLIYQYSRNLTGSISYEFSRNFELARNQNADLPDTTRDYNISAIQLSGYYNSNLQQDKGWAVRPFMEFSGFLGSASFEFQKFLIDVRRYVKLSSSTTIAGKVEAGMIFYHESDSLPGNLRFYAGGTNSVRGWNRHMLGPKRAVFKDNGRFSHYVPQGGRSLISFNLEVRQRLDSFIDGFGMAFFFDGGQVWRRVERTGNRHLRYATGAGIRYESPIGPVRVDVGYKLNPRPADLGLYRPEAEAGFGDYLALHFSIGQSF